MSVYSTDSLEDTNEILPGIQDFLHDVTLEPNPIPIEPSTALSSNAPLKLTTISTSRNKNDKRNSQNLKTGSNETKPGVRTDEDTRTDGNRNAIIANGEVVDMSQRQRLPVSKKGKRDITNRFQKNNANSSKQGDGGLNKRITPTSSKRSSKTCSTKRNCCPKETPMPMKPDKKLGNVLSPTFQQARKPRSYSELYHRRFSGPQYNVRAPEGSTLSVCGDSQRGQLPDNDTCLPASSRDDRSELNFYRHLIERSFDPSDATTRSTEANIHQRVLDDSNSSLCLDRVKCNAIGDKSKKSLGYRPYTIEEYKTLSIPKLDRSLGPDKVEMQVKREWLMRRRSYGNSVSARNRQRILLQARKLQSKHSAPDCFLPPLKDQEFDAKTRGDSMHSTISEEHEIVQKSNGTNHGKPSKKNVDVRKISLPWMSKKFERTSSFCSSLNSRDIIEDSYLESLRQRHLHEKEMVDRMINQALRR